MKSVLINSCVIGMIWLSLGGRMDAYLLYREWWSDKHDTK